MIPANTPPTKRANQLWPWIVVLFAVAFTAAIRIRLLQIPLERDEGEFAYMGQLMLQGHAPYSLAYSMKLPGIYAAYAMIMAVFGQTVGGIHLGFLLVNAASVVMVFLLGRRVFDPIAGAVAGVAYAIMTIQPGVLGTSAHATHFVVFFALGGILLLLNAIDSRRAWQLMASGLLFGIAFLMKQPGVFFILFGAAYLVWTDICVSRLPQPQSLRRLGLFLLSAAVPFGLTCLWLWNAGVFPRFWFWTYDYARVYGGANSLSEGLGKLGRQIRWVVAPSMILLWMLAFAGFSVFAWNRDARKRLWFMVSLFCFSALAVCAALRFSGHYFVLILPALALQAGLCVSAYTRMLSEKRSGSLLRLIPALLFLLAVCLPIYQQRELLFNMTPDQASRSMYGQNPFPEAVKIARLLRKHTDPKDVICVLGSEPEILFYSHRRSATGYIYMYPLTEVQPYAAAMRKEMIGEIVRARPKCLVAVPLSLSWHSTREPDDHVLRWVEDYMKVGYKPAANVWKDDPDVRAYSGAQPPFEILVRAD